MKFLFCFLLCLLSCHQANAQQLLVKHTEEVEVVSVLCHLGEISGYCWSEEEMGTPGYFNEVDSAFAPYRNHPSVRFVRDSLQRKGFGWSTPMELAMKFKMENGKVVLQKDLEIENYYDHITPPDERKLLILLQQFYDDTSFHQFYLQHKPLYEECEEAMRKVAEAIDLKWYDRFFGMQEQNTFRIVPGLLNGPGNFAVHCRHKDGRQSVIAVMGCAGTNEQGKVYYGISYTLPILIHEFNHSYCNALNEEYWDQMKDAVTAFFEPHAVFYRSMAYGHPIYVLNETFVEASMIRYLMSHPISQTDSGRTMKELINKYIEVDSINKKFTMIRDVIEVLGERERHPYLYLTMKDFMPQYVRAVNKSARKYCLF